MRVSWGWSGDCWLFLWAADPPWWAAPCRRFERMSCPSCRRSRSVAVAGLVVGGRAPSRVVNDAPRRAARATPRNAPSNFALWCHERLLPSASSRVQGGSRARKPKSLRRGDVLVAAGRRVIVGLPVPAAAARARRAPRRRGARRRRAAWRRRGGGRCARGRGAASGSRRPRSSCGPGGTCRRGP